MPMHREFPLYCFSRNGKSQIKVNLPIPVDNMACLVLLFSGVMCYFRLKNHTFFFSFLLKFIGSYLRFSPETIIKISWGKKIRIS